MDWQERHRTGPACGHGTHEQHRPPQAVSVHGHGRSCSCQRLRASEKNRAVLRLWGGFHSGDSGDFIEALAALDTPEKRREMGGRGRAAVERRYNWAKDAESLLALYRQTGGSGQTGRIP